MKSKYIKDSFILNNSIMANAFALRDNNVFYYDKLNGTEGRFCINKGEYTTAFDNIISSQGIIAENGRMFNFEIGESTVIREFLENGDNIKIAELEGVFFDIKINESGNYVCLGYIDGCVCLKIVNTRGVIISSLLVAKIAFASSISLIEDYIILGGFDKNNKYILVIVNYIGNIIENISLDVNAKENIITKILIYKDYFIVLTTGKSSSIYFINRCNKKIKRINPMDILMDFFVDINMYDDHIFILEENKIHKLSIEELISLKMSPKIHLPSIDFSMFYFQTMLFLRGLNTDNFTVVYESLFMVGIIFVILFSNRDITLKGIFILGFCYFWILLFSILSIKNLLDCLNKSKRIDGILDIYYGKKTIYINSHFIIFTLVFSVSTFLSFPEYEVLKSILIAIVITTLLLYFNYRAIENIHGNRGRYIVELLDDEDGKGELSRYINDVLRKTKEDKNNRIHINIYVEDEVNYRILERWKNTRGAILNTQIKYEVDNEKIATVIDFSKKDIKYSSYSIIMDYICYIKRGAQINSIEIDEYESNFLRNKVN